MQQGTTEASSPSMTAAPGAQPTVALGQSMTLAGTIVTLTPGLSTTVGTGPAATYIEIISDNAGQTMITLSSSGTAVTATVTNAPITITVASDFDTSITQAATPGGPESSGTGAVASSSSEAGAVDITYGTNWLVNIAIGIVGLGAALR
ncbi:hypothetical protein K458DRAFT_285154 [Lentithecium fluviatile CBS 122367]|uniref:Uncharacterized protein n=1 Tax=Lentithecium fluviatile CBS 122367 TaxID=1168545 RepID=A0A6G1JMU8_9PLEO|nr:hypothetical protein K458DRAFT_285154 [Lentithecium fluviatile CBS 122367]